MPDLSIRDLRLIFANKPAQLIAFEWAEAVSLQDANTYQVFVALLERAMDWIALQLGSNPQGADVRDENDISREVAGLLDACGFNVSLDASIGGHCDIVVSHGLLQWLCEAKIYTSYAKLYKGYLQLFTRYSTGQKDQDRGALLIYFKDGGMVEKMAEWCTKLDHQAKKRNRGGVEIEALETPAGAFRSTQAHPRTGRNYAVKHYPFALHWAPED